MAKKYLDLTGLTLFYSKLQEIFTNITDALDEVKSYLTFAKSCKVGYTTLNTIDVNTKLHIASISTDRTLKLINGKGAGDVAEAGRDILIIIKNISSNAVTVTMPSSTVSTTKLLCESSYSIPAGKHLEVSVVSDGTNAYYRVAEQN